MSRLIDPRDQQAGRRYEPPPQMPPLSAAEALREWQKVSQDRAERYARGEGFQPLAKALPVPEGGVRVVVRSTRRVLHRGYRLNGKVVTHARCNVKPLEVLPVGAEYDFENLSRSALMCRYPWCFRALLDEMGVDTVVGHYSRKLPR